MIEKPKYFDEFDDVWVDSEDEMVAGENNYIEIKCFDAEEASRLAEEKKQKEALAA